MKELVEKIVGALTDHPDRVRVSELDGATVIVAEVRCHPDDYGRIIGKGGKTIGALRTLANAVAQRSSRRAWVEVVQ